jgi:hypothetical protein
MLFAFFDPSKKESARATTIPGVALVAGVAGGDALATSNARSKGRRRLISRPQFKQVRLPPGIFRSCVPQRGQYKRCINERVA